MKNDGGRRTERRKFPVEMVILFLAAGFAAYNFSLAGGYIEGTHFSAGGLIAGIVVNVSLAIAASRFGSINGKKRTKQAMAAFIVMLILSPALVGPVIFYSLPETFLGHWIARAIWSAAWPLVADLAIVLAGAVMGKGLIALAVRDPAAQAAGRVRKSAGRLRAAAAQAAGSAAQAAKVYGCNVAGCGYSTGSQPAFAAHMSHHRRKERQAVLEAGLFAKAKEER